MPATQLSPAVATKIERAVESIEALTVAVSAAQQRTLTVTQREAAVMNVADAREECHTAFREFLMPTLRLVPQEAAPDAA